MKKILLVTILALAICSCMPKNNNRIAIDVLLTPSEEMQAQALQLNAEINRDNPESITLDENHIPHITLLQCFISKEDLPQVKKELEGIYKTVENDTFQAEGFSYKKDEEESFALIMIEKSPEILKLHIKVIALVKPYILDEASEKAFVPNPDGSPISESTQKYVPHFLDKYSFENYEPHISLGVAHKKVLDSLEQNVFEPLQFKATSVSIYQLGDHGTAQKLLWKSN